MRPLFLAALVAAPAAWGWESTCYTYADKSLEASAYAGLSTSYCFPEAGPNTARQRWVGGLDEHRLIWERTRVLAGLPEEVSRTWKLRVFTSANQVSAGAQTATSLLPAPFEQATRAQERALSVGELAQLPDFSYALWDWASGHETCPLQGIGSTAELCHDFATHMGPVNSNHFVPQAQAFYARYHQLALARAGECKSMRDGLGASLPRFEPYTKDCELEALALEAVGQHFLQDAWSMGHMWQRWGSPNLADFPPGEEQRDRAVLVALTAGLIHGSRGVLQRLPAWTSYDVNDALCAPDDRVRMLRDDGALLPGIGDDYLDKLPEHSASGEAAEQSRRLYSCAASGMLEVYLAAGASHGAPASLASGLASVDPTSASCFGQRATNQSMVAAAAIQLKLAGQQITLPLDSRLVGWLVPKVARESGEVPVSPKLRNQFRFELQRIVTVTRLLAVEKPEGTEAADGRLGDFLGAKPNGAHGGLASYVDPSLPWPTTADPEPAAKERALHLARLFHRGHAADWCRLLGSAELAALKAHAADSSLEAEGKAAACEACAELAVRHLRIGAPGAHDATREPLCNFLSPSSAYVYQPGPGEPAAIARAWCACP